ncbi:MAG: 2-amino-4-hydroxy-6-hydroxymethyldihydropteridine diphosphokinase [Polyangiales bacterium]
MIVGAGSNLGAREASIRAARDLLNAREGISVRAVSPLYETEPIGPPQPRYLNAAYRLETALPPPELLRLLLRIERRLGRHRIASQRWGPRSLDLDLLWDEQGAHDSRELRIPHPALETRGFALRPLLDVAPELEEVYGTALRRLESQPTAWMRRSIVRTRAAARGFEVEVESDSIVDACALSVRMPAPLGRPCSTRHAIVDPTPEAFAQSVRRTLESGFAIHFVSVSDCSKARWVTQFHGVSLGAHLDADVRLWTTSGANREACARFLVS